MEDVQNSMDKALKRLNIADHMLTNTYPLIRDPKILLTVMENIFLVFANAMAALLYYEKYHKRISSFQDNFESKFNLLKLEIADKYNIGSETLEFILEIKNKIQAHKNCAMEFKKKDSFIICSDKYNTEIISLKNIKDYILKAKIFINQIGDIIEHHDA